MSVSVTAGGSAGDDVKEFLRKKCEKVIQSKVADYITALKRGECVYFVSYCSFSLEISVFYYGLHFIVSYFYKAFWPLSLQFFPLV